MKVDADVLSDIAMLTIYHAIEEDLSSTQYGEIDPFIFDQTDCAVAIKRALAKKQKRIVLDIRYSTKGES